MTKDSGPLRVAVMGLGDIGREIARATIGSVELELVGVVDLGPSLVGRKLSELVPGAPASMRIEKDFSRIAGRLHGGVVLSATGSRFLEVLPQLEAAVRAGFHVVSTCEELAYPWLDHEPEADRLDRLAASRKVCVLGTGVNPGFVFDRLVATAGAASGRIENVTAERVVDVRMRRPALQRKVGVGLAPEEFARQAEDGRIGHIGLAQSAALAALGLGLDVDEYEDEISPVIAEEDDAGPPPVEAGQVAGLFQRVRGFFEGRQIVELALTLAAGAENPHDAIHISGEPPVHLEVKGGYAGDAATAWAVVNAASRVAAAEPGLLTVLDLPAGR